MHSNKFLDIERNGCEHELFQYVMSKKKLDWHTNYLLRFTTPYYLLAYKVCSFDCKKSINIANKIYLNILDFDPIYAKKIEFHLKLPILFDDSKKGHLYNKIDRMKALVFCGQFNNSNCVEYNKTFSLYKNHFFPEFRRGNKICVSDDKISIFKNKKLIEKINRKNKYDSILFKFK